MKKLLLSLFALLFGQATVSAQELVEFSTSMDFGEFDVVLKHLAAADRPLALELQAVIEEFRLSSSSGDVRRLDLDAVQGYVVLEREDPQAIGIALFTSGKAQAQIEAAYTRATEEMGI